VATTAGKSPGNPLNVCLGRVYLHLHFYLLSPFNKDDHCKSRSDKGLITTKDDGPWHMLRRKGVP